MLERSTELERVLFSQDRDLLAIADSWQETKRDFAGLVFAHQLKITIGQAIRDLELIGKSLDIEVLSNQIVFIPF